MRWQSLEKPGAVAWIALAGLCCATVHGFQEPRERSGCVVVSMRRVAPSAQDSAPLLSVEGLVLRVRGRKANLDYRIASGPILDPLYDSLSGRIFWISQEEVCEVRVGSRQARSVYQERGFSGIGRMWLARDTLLIRGGNHDSCTTLPLAKSGGMRARVICPEPARVP